MAKLTPKRQAFVDEYLVDLNATQAAIRAGYSEKTAYSMGQQLLKNVEVAAQIEQRQEKRAKKVNIEAEDVVRQLVRMGISDPRRLYHPDGSTKAPHELDDDIAHAVQDIECKEFTDREGNVQRVYKYKLADRRGAIELIGKHLGKALGQWGERTEHDIPRDSPLASLVDAINGGKSTLQPRDDNA